MPSPRKTKKRKVAVAAPSQPAAPQPLHVLTLKQWQENPGLQTELRRLVESPVFLMAHQTLLAFAFPGVEPSSKAEPNVSAEASDQALARKFAHRSGFGHYPRLLKALTTVATAALANGGYDSRLLEEDE